MPTNLYGPGDNYHPQNSHVLPAMLKRFYDAKTRGIEEINCWGSGSPLREFLHVDDLADATIFILENISSENKIFYDKKDNFNGILNVGFGLDISIKDLANLISSVVGYKGKITWDLSKPDGTPRKLLDVSKLNKLGWSPKIKLKKGIELTLKSFLTELQNKTIRI
tara:strand:- start:68 stop:565 length:498 start_codon:yes stop_codon:yes gene_type:complete